MSNGGRSSRFGVRGSGSDGALIQTALARMDAARAIETLEARNVPFFERRGFRVVLEGDVPESAVHVWAMRRG